VNVKVIETDSHIKMISICTPLMGLALGVALFIVLHDINLLISGNYSFDPFNIFNIIMFIWIASYGLPKTVELDKRTGNIEVMIFKLKGRRRFKFLKHHIRGILVEAGGKKGSRSKNNVGVIKVDKGELFVYNIFAFLLSPKKHTEALLRIKKVLSNIST
jgi:hypothetical protein